MSFKHFPAILLIAVSKLAVAADGQDVACLGKLPRDLVERLAISEPRLSLPTERNLDPASVNYDIASGGDGCYVIAKGFFNGRRRESFAFILVNEKGHPGLTVAAKQNGAWLIQHLPTFCDDVKFCYVKRGAPGTYVRSNALDTPPKRKFERNEIMSDYDVVVSGRLESTGITYANKSGKWFYVWTSD